MAQIDWGQALRSNFNPAIGIDFNPANFSRGASGASPLMDSSNTANAMPLAGAYSNAFDLLEQSRYKNARPEEQAWLRGQTPTPASNSDQWLIDYLKEQNSPEARKQALKDQLEYSKAQGDQMMKYRMTNDIIANLGSAARSAFGGYSDPNALARMAEGVTTSYNNALQASAPLTQLGQGIPSHTYYKV